MVYTTILIGHEIESNDIADPIRKWAISESHYFSERNVQAEFVVTPVQTISITAW